MTQGGGSREREEFSGAFFLFLICYWRIFFESILHLFCCFMMMGEMKRTGGAASYFV